MDMKHITLYALLIGMLLAACAILPFNPVETVATRSDLRGTRYCEILIVTGSLNRVEASVYNTVGLNDCPSDAWQALDSTAIQQQFNARAVVMNGPRYFMMDQNSLNNPDTTVVAFGDIQMRRVAVLQLPVSSVLGGIHRQPYTENTVNRETEYVFKAGQTVYELVSPDNQVYVMQSYSQIVDASLTEADLNTLADRLNLPEGWQYRVRTLDVDYVVRSMDGTATVIQDELENTYQRLDAESA
jgi:haloalkane dehalogenase